MGRFYVEDIVALKADPAIRAIVNSTWRDSDALDSQIERGEYIHHKEVSPHVFEEAFLTGRPPDGYVAIQFSCPGWGRTIVSEDSLTLIDRAVFVGDVFKRDIHAFESGTATKIRTKCKIQPIYTDLPYQGSEPWHHRVWDNELWVPSHELRFVDFQIGDYVAYKNWIGEVMNVRQEVTILLSNRSIVTVRDPSELTIPCWSPSINNQSIRRRHASMALADSLKDAWRVLVHLPEAHTAQPPSILHTGLKVDTKKSNLRLGHWIEGAYNASVTPQGVIIETRVVGLDVDWLTTNVFDQKAANSPVPDENLTTHDITSVRLCTKQLPDSSFGSRIARDMMVGDLCRFDYEPDAAEKYSGGAPGGDFRRISRHITMGYNMNIFNVIESRTETEVEWQDGSRTWHDSTDLVPYLAVDDHELWPGEVVSIKEAQSQHEGRLRSSKLGIVQSVDAEDRIAEVRWFKKPKVECFVDSQDQLLPGSKCGELSNEITSASLYELSPYYALSRRRGDIVMIRPNQHCDLDDQSAPLDFVSRLKVRLFGSAGESSLTPASSTEDYLWVGEVVNVSTEGKVTVRLGAMEPPQDVEVFVDEVVLLLSVENEHDDQDSYEDEDMADVSDYTDEDMESAGTLEETIEYEGGTRLDDGESDAWMTDDSNSVANDEGVVPSTIAEESNPRTRAEDSNPSSTVEESNPYSTEEGSDPSSTEEPPSSVKDLTERKMETVEETKVETNQSKGQPQGLQVEYRFNEYESMPPQFEILDEEPPDDHHFKSHEHQWNNAGRLRRIRKEFKLLQSSLPPGIWVRSWANRLDLVRVLLVGPQGTPYALAPFVIDFAFGDDFPRNPPETFFHSWTSGLGKINPNLYEDGTICLSVLGTWPESHDNEAWHADRSSLLQVVVSVLGLVLVERPYYNEAGFEELAGKDESAVGERMYSERALVMSKGFVLHALRNDVPGLKPVIDWVYKDPRGPRLLRWVVREATALRDRGARDKADEKMGEAQASAPTLQRADQLKLSRGGLMLLGRYLPALEKMAE